MTVIIVTCPACRSPAPDHCDESHLDRWNTGAIEGYKNTPQTSNDADYLAGYAEGQRERKVQVVMPARPEGYYHAPIGTFEQ